MWSTLVPSGASGRRVSTCFIHSMHALAVIGKCSGSRVFKIHRGESWLKSPVPGFDGEESQGRGTVCPRWRPIGCMIFRLWQRSWGRIMDVSLQQILQTANVSDLKTLGRFLEIKRFIEAQLHLKLGANGWGSLLLKLKALNALGGASDECESYFCDARPYQTVRAEVSKKIGFKITAKNQAELKAALHKLSTCSARLEFDPHKRFEKKKLKNFINSSRLEGIEIPISDEKASLEKLLAKHGRQLNG
ncbi:hypothetical protein C4K22_1042 [Pseudomonas chlororaphis subsp. aurantiaca]|nr:hypothetical protein C4K22_1042 [Pseudomonas chlororaphis subsp. aurantiaca]AZD40137.1 hypothetical protein C4K21_1044 [Pseudomonas chlororaphis subsp. aurantiaca]AZD77611.1 hypothetical protein C4K15_1025 [Pseudomonas chlororaphis subsp. aurantiaca]